MRCLSFQSLGVETNDGTVGGRGFLGANLEVRRDVTDVVGIVGFVDFGYVTEDVGYKEGASHSGDGLGLRSKPPEGPHRADIGFPLDGESEEDFGIFIGIGHAF